MQATTPLTARPPRCAHQRLILLPRNGNTHGPASGQQPQGGSGARRRWWSPAHGGHSSGYSSDDAAMRDAVRRLTRIFFTGPTEQQEHTSDSAPAAAGLDAMRVMGTTRPGVLLQLPLWATAAAALPGSQVLLHVHAPHQVHLFDALFSSSSSSSSNTLPSGEGSRETHVAPPLPWRFGHLYAPPGLGLTAEAAPLTGVIMEVTRAVRLADGKLMVLASGLSRFRIMRWVQAVPFPAADVAVLPDEEEVHAAHGLGLAAALAAADARGAASIERVMAVVGEAAHAAAVAAALTWHGFEHHVPRSQAWREAGPVEPTGATQSERMAASGLLLGSMVDAGVLDSLPLPGGSVAGPWPHVAPVAAAAHDAARDAAHDVAESLLSVLPPSPSSSLDFAAAAALGTDPPPQPLLPPRQPPLAPDCDSDHPISSLSGPSGMGLSDGVLSAIMDDAAQGGWTYDASYMPQVKGSPVSSPPLGPLSSACPSWRWRLGGGRLRLNTVAERGVQPWGPAAGAVQGQAPGLSGSPEFPPSDWDLEERALIALEQQVWQELDLLASLALRAHTRALSLPLGLLQLRPPQASPGLGGGGSGVWGAASEGLDVSAPDSWPPLRRAQRLSFAVAGLFCEAAFPEQRQAVLEQPSVAGRLRLALGLLQHQRAALSARAMLRDMERGARRPRGKRDSPGPPAPDP